ncbi:phosphopentomutase-like [Mytilus edulis]|uniref:phosphopentomutase-like n=1 Tax=Mytilus edulis TaxID=6550 RepID=UPI0039EEFE82
MALNATNYDTGDEELNTRLREWFEWDKNEATRSDILQLVNEKNIEELKKRLLKRMEFGTAGLRTRMAAGFSMMNDLTIIQTTQGLCQYLLKNCPSVKSNGVVVGYDGRHNSERFAWLTATVFINAEVPVYLYSRVCPTPYVAYAVIYCKADCGIMVTASHNPKEDNGYKVYGSNGSQIISPVDKHVAKSIEENLVPLITSWDASVVEKSPLRKDPYNDILKHYNEDLKKLCYFREQNSKSSVTFTYTAMHGVGYPYVLEACKVFGVKEPVPVVEQIMPDPEFPTVRYPNPEEGEGALSLAIDTANANNSCVILANDPDADRLAIAEKLEGGKWHIFSGNEIGALLGWWSWLSFRQKNPDVPASEVYMLASTVSSKILQTIARNEGFNFEETLTGFKWMGNKSDEYLKAGKTVLFAFEEAIGFMCGSSVLDKDGVSASMVTAEMATHLYDQGLTLYKQLENIYQKYGYHISLNSYFICHDKDVIKKLFDDLRNFNGTGKHPDTCGPYKIKYVRDLTVGIDNSKPDNIPTLPVSKSSQMVTYTFENGCVATLRTSGTEPKIKYYTEHKPDPQKGLDKQSAQHELEDIVQCIITYFLQPEKYNLQTRVT